VVRVSCYRFRGPGFDSRRYQIFWEAVGLERGPLSLVRTTEELLERTVAAPVYKTEINGRRNSLRWPRDTLYTLKFALTSPTSGGRSVGIVRWRTKATELYSYLASHLCVGFLSGVFPSGFPTKTMYTFLLPPVRATCAAHLIYSTILIIATT
jgi:hypothetical protein